MRNALIEKEYKERQKIDSLLMNIIIPLLVFVIGMIISLNSLFNLQDNKTPLFYKIMFIIFVGLIFIVAINAFIFLIYEISTMHNENLNIKDKVNLMKFNFNITFNLFIFIMFMIAIMSIGLFIFKLVDFNKFATSSKPIFIFAILIFIAFLLYFLNKTINNNKTIFNHKIIKKHKVVRRISFKLIPYYLKYVLPSIFSVILSFLIIYCLLYFNNIKNIYINYYKNGIVKIFCDFDIENGDSFILKLSNNKISTISEIDIDKRLNYIDVHLKNDSNVATKSAFKCFNNKKLSPFSLLDFRINNSFYVDLNRMLDEYCISSKENMDCYSIIMTISVKNHYYCVKNQFILLRDNFEFTNESTNLCLRPIDLFPLN